ncbi:aminoglycoside phosphotransferase [Streptacidiphilus sp. 4-A2]|nr:aminoglycoside phosphotransferase [Streptacidiphilus sp. 4-A2]
MRPPSTPPSPLRPRLLWHTQATGWDFLGFEFIDGRTAHYTPASPDLPLIIAALEELAQMPCPAIPLLDCAARYNGYTRTPELFTGDTLLHTDINPENTLIAGNHAHLVDWAWPTKGAAWVDPAVWAIRLISAGHTAEQAEAWAARLPAWSAAPPASITAFAEASVRMWTQIADQHLDAQWTKDMAASATAWVDHRR